MLQCMNQCCETCCLTGTRPLLIELSMWPACLSQWLITDNLTSQRNTDMTPLAPSLANARCGGQRCPWQPCYPLSPPILGHPQLCWRRHWNLTTLFIVVYIKSFSSYHKNQMQCGILCQSGQLSPRVARVVVINFQCHNKASRVTKRQWQLFLS